MTTEIVTSETMQPMRLMEVAIQNNTSVDNLERLMEMQQKWDANEAKKAFNRALTEFQAKCPSIKKMKQGHNYKYAPLSDIITQIKAPLMDAGLSYRFEQDHKNGISVKCVVTHVDGHKEETVMEADADTTGSKNAVQAIGSTVTYLQRYTLIGALGIATADEDMDGRIGNEIDHLSYMACVRDNFDEITGIKTAFANEDYEAVYDAWRDLPREIQEKLWVAPSKGGVFTSEEREAIKVKKQ